MASDRFEELILIGRDLKFWPVCLKMRTSSGRSSKASRNGLQNRVKIFQRSSANHPLRRCNIRSKQIVRHLISFITALISIAITGHASQRPLNHVPLRNTLQSPLKVVLQACRRNAFLFAHRLQLLDRKPVEGESSDGTPSNYSFIYFERLIAPSNCSFAHIDRLNYCVDLHCGRSSVCSQSGG